jgi:hypothetical protein
LYFESRNEFGNSLGPKTARSIFSRLCEQATSIQSGLDISVTLIPDDGALDRVLSLPGLRTLTIRVNSPNADQTSSAARKRVLEKLAEANAKQLDERWTKTSGTNSLTPSDTIKETAEVAAETGYVRAEGRMPDGRSISAATDDYPKKYTAYESSGDTFVQRLLNSLGSLF